MKEDKRVIKFRAWDKEHRVMVEPVYFPFLGVGVITNVWIDGVETCPPLMGVVDDYVLLEFTGLLDKQGKEIYEGDILTMYRKNKDILAPRNFKVYWSKQWASFNIESIEKDGDESLGLPLRVGTFYDMGEIIGNIYEHPELLTLPTSKP